MITRAIHRRPAGRRSGRRIAAGLACICFLALAGPSSADEDSTVVATVGGVAITAGAVQREMARLGGHDPERFDELSEKRAALEAVIRAELLARAAIEAGYDRRPDIQDEIKRLLGQRYRAERQQSQAPLRTTEEDVRAYYDAHRNDFAQPPQVRGSIAFLRARADATEEQRRSLRKEAEALSRAVIEGRKTFVAVARDRSDDRPSAARGGDVGWIHPGQSIQRLEPSVVNALSDPDIASRTPKIVETERGVYLVLATDRRGGGIAPLEEVSRQIAIALVAEKQREQAEAELVELRGRFPLEVDDELLQSLTPAVLATSSGGPPSFPVGRNEDVMKPSRADEPGGTAR